VIVLLFPVDIKIAGSLALAISLPTMLVAFARYSRDRSFDVLRANTGFVLAMATGSIIGTILGARSGRERVSHEGIRRLHF
jgi:uncharacterized membrane protein YfcA